MSQGVSQKNTSYRSYYNQMRLLYQQPVAQVSTALILTLFTIAFFGFFAIRPSFVTISELVKEIEEKREIDQKMTQKINSLTSAQDEYLQFKDTLEVYNRAVPDDLELENTVALLEYLVSTSKTEIRSLSLIDVPIVGEPSSEQTLVGDSFPSLQVRLVADGDEASLLGLLSRLSDQQRLMLVETTTFSVPNEEDVEAEMRMSVRLRVFWNAGSGATPGQELKGAQK